MRLLRRPRGQVYVLAHSRNHVNILRGVVADLVQGGVTPRWLIFPGNPGARQAKQVLNADGIKLLNAAKMLPTFKSGDVLVFCLRTHLWEPSGAFDRVPELLARGVRLLQVVEGGRFNFPDISHPDVPFLGWGPSVHVAGRQARVVGSPVLEAVQLGLTLDQRAPMAVVNYKFRGEQRGPHWLAEALAACKAAGLQPVVSGHPLYDVSPGEGIAFSDRPVAALCAEAQVVISRPSTVIYESLRAGAQPFLFPTRGEAPVEYADPRGAFPIAFDGSELTEQLLQWQTGQRSYAPQSFLNAHVDIDARRPATRRIADEIRAALKAPKRS